MAPATASGLIKAGKLLNIWLYLPSRTQCVIASAEWKALCRIYSWTSLANRKGPETRYTHPHQGQSVVDYLMGPASFEVHHPARTTSDDDSDTADAHTIPGHLVKQVQNQDDRELALHLLKDKQIADSSGPDKGPQPRGD
jgi:hypothetical protein